MPRKMPWLKTKGKHSESTVVEALNTKHKALNNLTAKLIQSMIYKSRP